MTIADVFNDITIANGGAILFQTQNSVSSSRYYKVTVSSS